MHHRRHARSRGAAFVLVGLAVWILAAAGILALGSPAQRVGYAPRTIALVNQSNLDTAVLREKLAATRWGREINLAVAVASPTPPQPAGSETEEPDADNWAVACDATATDFLAHAFPQIFPDGIRISPDSAYLCVDPYAGTVQFTSTIYSGAYFPIEGNLTALIASNRLTEEAFADQLQGVADGEGGSYALETVPRWAALVLAGVVALTVCALLAALDQRAHARCLGVRWLPRTARRALAAEIEQRYTRTSLLLGDTEVLAAAEVGTYGPRLAARCAAWRNRYTQLAAEMSALDASVPLWAWRNRELLARLDHLSALVTVERERIEADAAQIQAAQEPTSDLLPEVIDQLEHAFASARDLADQIAVGGPALRHAVHGLEYRLKKVTTLPVHERVLALDDLLGEIAGITRAPLARFASEHGHPYPYEDLFTDCAILAGHDWDPAPEPRLASDDDLVPPETFLAAAHAPARRRTPLPTPVTPGVVAASLACALAVGIGASATASSVVATPEALAQRDAYATAPAGLPGRGYVAEIRSDADLVHPASVEIYDPAHAFADPVALADALKRVGFALPQAPRVVVLTSADTYTVEPDLRPERPELSSLFPEYLQRGPGHTGLPVPARDAFLAEPRTPNTITVWLAGRDLGVRSPLNGITSSVPELQAALTDHDLAYADWAPDRFLRSDTPEATVWNVLVSSAHLTRGITKETAAPVVVPGTSPTQLGVAVGALTVLLTLIAFTGIQRLQERRQRRRRGEKMVNRTVTTSTLEADHLALEITSLTETYPAYRDELKRRHAAWEAQLDRLLILTGARDGHEAPLEERLDAARLLAVQQASLWRTRSILAGAPGWWVHWQREIYTTALLADRLTRADMTTLMRLERALRDGYIGPAEALSTLDRLVATWGAAAAARGVLVHAPDLDTSGPGWRFIVGEPPRVYFTLPLALVGKRWWGRALRGLVLAGVLALIAQAFLDLNGAQGTYVYTEQLARPRLSVPANDVRIEDGRGLYDAARVREAAEAGRFGAALNIFVVTPQPDPNYREPVIKGPEFPGLMRPLRAVTEPAPTDRTLMCVATPQGLTCKAGKGLYLTKEAEKILANAVGRDTTDVLVSLFTDRLVTY